MPKHTLSNKGFTLPELLLAAAILLFVINSLLLLFINIGLLNETNRNLSIATSHAQFVMEGVKNADFSTLGAVIAGGSYNYNTTSIRSAGLVALRNENIITQAVGANPLDVTVTVNWQNRSLKNQSFVLETLISG